MRFAAIAIGSNAVRLLLATVIENGKSPVFKKEALVGMHFGSTTKRTQNAFLT